MASRNGGSMKIEMDKGLYDQKPITSSYFPFSMQKDTACLGHLFSPERECVGIVTEPRP
jgi:hypothetical protein